MLNLPARRLPLRMLPAAALVFLASPFLLLSGCGSNNGTSAGGPTVTISANPASIASGTSSTLSVTAKNATSVTITGSDGSSYTLSSGDGGTQTVSPTTTTTYTATATGNGGSATATATVTVSTSAPTVTITATPTSVPAGTAATLSVTATNATTVTISGSDGSSYTLLAAGGNQSVTPAATTTYTATATGPGGTVTATATVTVTAAVTPTVTISASPTTINAGDSSTLTVTATNATQPVVVSGSDGSSYTLATTGGTQSVSPTTTTTYVATAAGSGGNVTANVTVTVTQVGPPTVTITASPTSIASGGSSVLTVMATNATSVTVAGTDNSSYTLQPTGGTQTVSPTATTTYTATATGTGGTTTATATVSLVASGSLDSVDHVIFMMQENHSFDNYFGMLDPYRDSKGFNTYDGTLYEVDGLTVPTENSTTLRNFSNTDDVDGADITYPIFPLTSTCVDDESSAWEESYGDVNTYNFSTSRPILMNGFVHNGAGYDQSCAKSKSCSGSFNDPTGERVMGYYTQSTLNYYYYMASQFALSDRWFSPVSSFTVDNRIATMTGGTTLGLTNSPSTDKLPQLSAETIFEDLDKNGVSWKIYYSATEGDCLADDECTGGATANFPATEFDTFSYSAKYVYMNTSHAACTGNTQPSSVVGDTSNSFCIDPTHIAPLSDPTYGYFADLKNGTLPSFAWISPGFANNDEHPGSGQSVLKGQVQVASIINALMTSTSWPSSVFFLAYDEGGGPYDHVPPVPGSTNINTDFPVGDATASDYPDILSIAVNPDKYNPCQAPNGVPGSNPNEPGGYCDLMPGEPGYASTDAAAVNGFAAQLGFRVPNMVISPFTKPHYVSHIPMDHTAVIRFVETRFIGSNATPLTARDGAQPNLLDFFDFTNPPWATPPTPPTPLPSPGNCNAASFGGGS